MDMKKQITKEELVNDAVNIYKRERKKNPKFILYRDNYSKFSKYKRADLSKHFGSYKDFIIEVESFFKPTREDIINDAKQIYSKGLEKNKNFVLKRDYYVKTGVYSKNQIEEEFGTFTDLLNIVKEEMGIKDEEGLTREDFNIVKDESSKGDERKYFITSAIVGSEISMPFLKSIKTYCKHNKAELIILVMRGISKKDIFLPHVLKEIEDYICTEIKFNENLQAKDFKLSPMMMKPLTGIARIGSKETNLIVASPKQQVESVAVSNRTLPHISFTTGTLSTPEYTNDRIGVLGEQDNIIGGLIVEIRDEEIFHLRMVGADKKGCFYDLDNYYTQDSVKKSTIEAFVMGDLHSGSEDESAINAWKDCIKLTKPKYVIMHDVMDNASINPHEEKNIVYNANLPEFAKTLENELNLLGDTLNQWTSEFNKTQFVITKGNHCIWLTKYLEQGKYARQEQAHNHRFALSLAPYVLDGKNPIAEYINKKFKIKNIKFLEVDDDFKIKKQQLGYHGHRGSNSGKSSAAGLELSQGMGIFGHTHSCSVLRGVMIVGTSTKLKLAYNKDGASSWTHSSALLYPSGHKTLIISIKGKWKI